jgi:hypothetical protein
LRLCAFAGDSKMLSVSESAPAGKERLPQRRKAAKKTGARVKYPNLSAPRIPSSPAVVHCKKQKSKDLTQRRRGRGEENWFFSAVSAPLREILISCDKKKNRIGRIPRPSGPIRCGSPRVGLREGVGLSGFTNESHDSWPRSASYFSSPETPDNYRYRNPRRELD